MIAHPLGDSVPPALRAISLYYQTRKEATMNEFLRRLQEARNTGEWLESRLHLMFTEIADGMFGEGRLTREERIALSSAIGGALDAFRLKVEEVAGQLYSRDPYAEPMPMDQPGAVISEAADLVGAYVALVERAVRRDGTIPIKLIQPGWGSSGYYSAEVLQRDGPKVFTPKIKMHWNHPTAVEEAERPEGDLNTLAAELVTAARWEESGPAGPGLYADAKVFGAYQEAVNELAPHIGVSIRASGRAVSGEAEGRKGALIQEIAGARSVDFVTQPGAGGRIIEMFEAARSNPFRQTEIPTKGATAVSEELQKQLQEANGRLAQVEQANARLQEALVLREAQEMVGRELIKHTLPVMTQDRLAKQLSGGVLPLTEARQLDRTIFAQRITEAVQAEVTYLQTVAGYGAGRIEGVGGGAASGQVDEAAATKRMQESFARMGLNEKEAGHAAGGRLY
jgi:hypothetical protein